jgi:hypothetical protein
MGHDLHTDLTINRDAIRRQRARWIDRLTDLEEKERILIAQSRRRIDESCAQLARTAALIRPPPGGRARAVFSAGVFTRGERIST